ncbi:MAG: Thymidylate synthase [Candidatus Saccharibacteria bacterium GW2011_GWA2_46_10]|nr:MAG: Thymidylate synthase [Candidatus Saccharibacteria bacterium GW2011_GWA2_46_10]
MITYKPARERTPDTQYQDLLRRILTTGRRIHPIHGRLHSAPEGDAIMVLGAQMRFDMSNGFPLQPIRDNTKSFPGALGELIGFLHGARTLETLKEYGCPAVFWEKWVTKEKCEIFGLPEHDLGDGSYGAAWASFPQPDGTPFNQVEHLIKQIKERPYLRTHILTPWIPFYTLQHSELKRKVVVAPCHGWVHVVAFPETKELSLHHYQRSGDVPVGVVLNMVEYAALGMLIAREIGYTFVEYVHTISDAHLYESQIPFVEELLAREPRTLPTVTLDESITTVLDARREHFTLTDYNPHPRMIIPTPV